MSGYLFTDPRRHFRGDARALRAAIRKGWLHNATQAHRDDLSQRWWAAYDQVRQPRDDISDGLSSRMALASAWTFLEMSKSNLRDRVYALGEELTGQRRGRPRLHARVQDYARHRLSAGDLGRAYRGRIPCALAMHRRTDTYGWIEIPIRDGRTVAVAFKAITIRRGEPGRGERWVAYCPLCGDPRVHLYRFADAVACRCCARLTY